MNKKSQKKAKQLTINVITKKSKKISNFLIRNFGKSGKSYNFAPKFLKHKI